jgi:hypothetical protein
MGNKISRNSVQVGVSANVGVEIFLTREISIAAQQSLAASLTKNFINPNVPQLSQDIWDIGLGASSLILHIYLTK